MTFRPEPRMTLKLTGTANTYPFPASSQARRSFAERPQTGGPAERHRGAHCPGDHAGGQLGLGGELHVAGDLGP